MVTWSKFHTEEPKNVAAQAMWHPGFVHPWSGSNVRCHPWLCMERMRKTAKYLSKHMQCASTTLSTSWIEVMSISAWTNIHSNNKVQKRRNQHCKFSTNNTYSFQAFDTGVCSGELLLVRWAEVWDLLSLHELYAHCDVHSSEKNARIIVCQTSN